MAFWQNSPATTSPRNADNLSRAERYLTATAGSNGDYYVNIDGAVGLATGDMVHISFPSATTATSNARLSVDNGTNYKNVKDINAVQLIASSIQNKSLQLYYNGTDFLIKISNSSTGTSKVVPVSEYIALPVVLYDNATGINGTSSATLSETSANFRYLEVFFTNYDGLYSSEKIHSPNGKTVSLNSTTPITASNAITFRSARMAISGTTITMSNEMQAYPVAGDGFQCATLSSAITVTKVLGYR